MALGLRRVKTEQEIAAEWALENVIPAHLKAANGKTDCLFSAAGKLTVEAIKIMVNMLFGVFGPAVWIPNPKNPHKGKVGIQAPNREIAKVSREDLPMFFGVNASDPLDIKASGQTLQRFLQVFGAAYAYFQADKGKIEYALIEALGLAKTPTPNGVLQVAKGKVREGVQVEEGTLTWGNALVPVKTVSTDLEQASVTVAKVIHVLNSIGTLVAKANGTEAVTSTDLDRISQALLAAMKRLDNGVSETGQEVLEMVQETEEEFEDVPEPVGVEAHN